MKRITLWFWLLPGLLALAARALGPGWQVQDLPPLERVAVLRMEFWPEYDRPAMLVIYRITLPADATLPGRLSLRIPARAGRPHAVAQAASPQEMLVNAVYEYEAGSGSPWAWVHIQVEQPYVQVEYYDPALEKDGTLRTFLHEWPGDLAVDRLIVHVQQPWNATDLTVEPSLDPIGATGTGLQLYEKDLGALPQGAALRIEIRYHKPDDLLTVQHMQAAQVQPEEAAKTSNAEGAKAPTLLARVLERGTDYLPWVLSGLGILLVAVAGWLWWRNGREEGVATRSRGGGKSKGKRPATRICPVCHTRSLPGAQFCHRCGAPLT